MSFNPNIHPDQALIDFISDQAAFWAHYYENQEPNENIAFPFDAIFQCLISSASYTHHPQPDRCYQQKAQRETVQYIQFLQRHYPKQTGVQALKPWFEKYQQQVPALPATKAQA